jgi:group II intron reverse transcriptase/maturase
VNWILDADIRAFFDSVSWEWLVRFLEHRIADRRLVRLIGKWLKAGVMEHGQWQRTEAGSPQGGVISPLLANIYLHHVLDVWFEREVKPRLVGSSFMLRYADDAVLVFANERDARRVMEVLPKRFGRFGLELHPEKTRLVGFKPGIPALGRSFDLLGFTHYWGRSKSGCWTIYRKTAKDRFRRTLRQISRWCRANRHQFVRDQHVQLVRKLRGHFAYFGIRGNYRSMGVLRFRVERIWIKWLSRRSQRGRLNWEKAAKLLKLLPLPAPRISKPCY